MGRGDLEQLTVRFVGAKETRLERCHWQSPPRKRCGNGEPSDPVASTATCYDAMGSATGEAGTVHDA